MIKYVGKKRVNESLIIKLGAQMTLVIEKEKSYHGDSFFRGMGI